MTTKQHARERAARIAALRAEQARRDRRRNLLVFGTATVVCLGLIAAVAVPLVSQARRQAAVVAAANAPIDGVQQFQDLSKNHVAGTVDYPMSPPVGGDHDPVWQNCGVYTEPITAENAVHSLEHGAAWIAYSPDLPADQVAALTGKAEGNGYTLVSPYPGLESPIVLSAWGLQLPVEDAGDARVDTFLSKYRQGEQTPEPGAACLGGVGTPVA